MYKNALFLKAKHGLITGVFILAAIPLTVWADPASYMAYAKSSDLSAFNKWMDVKKSSQEEHSKLVKNAEWKGLIGIAEKQRNLETLQMLNTTVNSYDYIVDSQGWNKNDYWATPKQFLTKGGGDCEDFAITKYMALRDAGWSADNLRITVLKDTQKNELHAVLLVTLNEVEYLMDNQVEAVLPVMHIEHYSPIYSINEVAWWQHQPTS